MSRVRHIVGVMTRFEWLTGISGPALAREWKISPDVVAKMASEASKIVLAAFAPEELQMQVQTGLHLIAKLAVKSKNYGDATRALGMLATVTGTSAAAKVEHSGTVAISSGMPPALARARANPARYGAQLRAFATEGKMPSEAELDAVDKAVAAEG